MPKIFHVNWFRQSHGKFCWPGFGDNIRVIDWMLRRCEGDDAIAERTPIGFVPKKGSLNTSGLDVKWDDLMSVPKDYWVADAVETRQWMERQVGVDLPAAVRAELDAQETRIKAMPS